MYRSLSSALVPVLFAAAIASPVGAQQSPAPWDPWIGCWDLVPRGTTYADNAGRVCVLPTSSQTAVDLVSVVGDSVVSRQRLEVSDKRDVKTETCAGVESIHADGSRVYLRTTMKCGAEHRLVNSVMAMSTTGEWLDIKGVAFGPNVGVRASRYRETPASVTLPNAVTAALAGRERGATAARIAASGRVRLGDVIDATKYLETGVLQTWLAEQGQGFGLDAKQLVMLEEAGVAPSVIDVMVALSYPEVFALDRTRLGEAPPDVRGDERGVFGGEMIDPFGYGYDPYGYGYGRGLDWYSGRQPVVVVQRPASEASEEDGGKVVKGRGYVSGRNGSGASGSSGSGEARGRSGGTSGGSSGSDKPSSTGRKAKPKGSSE